jgi:hypothetical protein
MKYLKMLNKKIKFFFIHISIFFIFSLLKVREIDYSNYIYLVWFYQLFGFLIYLDI